MYNVGIADVVSCGHLIISPACVYVQGVKRAQLFVQDFILPQLVGQDIMSLWDIANPMGLLVNLLAHMGHAAPEPRSDITSTCMYVQYSCVD